MFDFLRIEWDYEPIDLAGYIPDFVLHGKRRAIAEIKPAMDLEELAKSRAKIDASGWDGGAYLFGAILFRGDEPSVGLGDRDRVCGVDAWEWVPVTVTYCHACNGFTPTSIDHAWRCFKCGAEGRAVRPDRDLFVEVLDMWTAAGNDTQWRGGDAA